jgi:HEAT repeat protein
MTLFSKSSIVKTESANLKEDCSERIKKMVTAIIDQHLQTADKVDTFTTLPIAVEFQSDPRMGKLLADLSPDTPWGERKMAAQRLGYMRCQEALPELLAALPGDPFWMVRNAIIQAVVMIGDPEAIPALQDVANNDSFQVVRSYAAKAIERLSLKS